MITPKKLFNRLIVLIDFQDSTPESICYLKRIFIIITSVFFKMSVLLEASTMGEQHAMKRLLLSESVTRSKFTHLC